MSAVSCPSGSLHSTSPTYPRRQPSQMLMTSLQRKSAKRQFIVHPSCSPFTVCPEQDVLSFFSASSLRSMPGRKFFTITTEVSPHDRDPAQYVSRLSTWRSHVCPRSGADEEDPRAQPLLHSRPSGRRSVLCGLQHHSLRNRHGGHHL